MHAFGLSETGQCRTKNQDTCLVLSEPIGKFDGLFLVCDGLGGHKAGDHASRYAAERMEQMCRIVSHEDTEEALRRAIEKTNTYIYRQGRNPNYQDMATTMVGCAVERDTAWIINIGDSRAYLFRDGTCSLLTQDHTYFATLLQLGYEIEDQSNIPYNLVTKALGAEREVSPDITPLKLQSNDLVLLCSDGLYKSLSEEELQKIVTGQETVEEKVNRLVQCADQNSGTDNITAVLVDMEKVEENNADDTGKMD